MSTCLVETSFALVGWIKSPTVVTINTERACAGSGIKIRLPATKVLLYATIGDLSNSKKLLDWAVLNALLLPPSLTKVVVPEG